MDAVKLADTIASTFVDARRNGRAIPDFPGVIPASLGDAYQVQDCALARVHDSVAGWKVGRIMPPQSDRYGADRLAGPILSRSIQRAPQTGLAVGHIYEGGFGAAEAEFLFRIARTPAASQTRFSLEDARGFVDAVHVGIEIASSPLATINVLGPPVIISDFGNNNGLIIGPEITDWRTCAFADWPVQLLIDGKEAGRGMAAAFPDGPLGSVRFLLELMAARRIPLAPGTWVSTGAITGVHDVVVGQTVEARFNNGRLITGCTIQSAK